MKKLEELEAPEALKVLELRYKTKESVYDKGLINIIENALKRNEPMNVISKEQPFYDIDKGDYIDNQPSMYYRVYYCPKCNEVMRDGDTVNYCCNCGQKLEWSD